MDPEETTCRCSRIIARHHKKTQHQARDFPISKLMRFKYKQKLKNLLSGLLPNSIALFIATLMAVGLWVSPSAAEIIGTPECADCHLTSAFTQFHGHVHTAAPGSGLVKIFEDTGHDDAVWHGTPPYFAVSVDCDTCHNTADIQVSHGAPQLNVCNTCHNSEDRTITGWDGGCQASGCHQTFHEDSTAAHLPFEDPYDGGNDCSLCHLNGDGDVVQSQCLNCHSGSYGPGYTTPPISSTDALDTYIGPARINFSLSNSAGKVVIGRTFYRLDDFDCGEGISAAQVFVSAPGDHVLEFWSIDQSGNMESSNKWESFTILPDTTPPVTTSDAQSSYVGGGTIRLTATDNSTLGVKKTYYKLNNGPVKTGTSLTVGSPQSGTNTLLFWSEDWAGNVENQNSVTFTVYSGNGTIRLVWQYLIDAVGGPQDSSDWTYYQIRVNNSSGQIVKQGTKYGPWSGITNISVPASPTRYWVYLDYWSGTLGGGDESTFYNVYITYSGDVEVLNY